MLLCYFARLNLAVSHFIEENKYLNETEFIIFFLEFHIINSYQTYFIFYNCQLSMPKNLLTNWLLLWIFIFIFFFSILHL